MDNWVDYHDFLQQLPRLPLHGKDKTFNNSVKTDDQLHQAGQDNPVALHTTKGADVSTDGRTVRNLAELKLLLQYNR